MNPRLDTQMRRPAEAGKLSLESHALDRSAILPWRVGRASIDRTHKEDITGLTAVSPSRYYALPRGMIKGISTERCQAELVVGVEFHCEA